MAKVICLNGKSYFVRTKLLKFLQVPLNGKSYLLKWQKLFRLNQILEFLQVP